MEVLKCTGVDFISSAAALGLPTAVLCPVLREWRSGILKHTCDTRYVTYSLLMRNAGQALQM